MWDDYLSFHFFEFWGGCFLEFYGPPFPLFFLLCMMNVAGSPSSSFWICLWNHPRFFLREIYNNQIKWWKTIVVSYSSNEGFPNRRDTSKGYNHQFLVRHILSNYFQLISKTRYPHNLGLHRVPFVHLHVFELIFQRNDFIQNVDFIHASYLYHKCP